MSTRKSNTAAKGRERKAVSKASTPTKKKTAELAVFDGSISHLIHRAEQCSTDIFGTVAPNGGLTPRQYAILNSIQDNPGVSQTGLVGMTGIDRSTLADIVRRMLDKGLVQRERTEQDARAYSVKLTRKGTNTLKKIQPRAEMVDKKILDSIPKEHRTLFVSLLAQMVANLSERDTDATD
jgi:DNA-binding MarR family transcriptional regulator